MSETQTTMAPKDPTTASPPADTMVTPPKEQSSSTKVAPSPAAPPTPAPTTPDIAGTVQGAQALYSQWQTTNKELEETLRHTPKFEQTNPIESLSSWAGILGLFGGAMMRQPAMGMLAAAKGVLEGQKANDLDKYNKAMQEFQMHRDYLSQVSGNLAKQIQLIQQNQHYTNQEKIAHERLLLQAMGVNQRGAAMMQRATQHAQNISRQETQHAFTMGMDLLKNAGLPPEKFAEAQRHLSERFSQGGLTMAEASNYVNDFTQGKYTRGSAGTLPVQYRALVPLGEALEQHFGKEKKQDALDFGGQSFTYADWTAYSNGIARSSASAKADTVGKAMQALSMARGLPTGGAAGGGGLPVIDLTGGTPSLPGTRAPSYDIPEDF